jgi:elongation factor P hydroxylase
VNTLLEQIFKESFFVGHRTLLVGGAEEPLYQPAGSPAGVHRIYYRADYFASALHEVAHWCIAGEARRKLVDYGYWYAADGRDKEQQQEFERVEVRPQAIEWHFAHACGRRFHLSIDNLEGGSDSATTFAEAVREQALRYCRDGLPSRAEKFARALAKRFGGVVVTNAAEFDALAA